MSKTGGELLMDGMANSAETSSPPMTSTNENGEPQWLAVVTGEWLDQVVADPSKDIAYVPAR